MKYPCNECIVDAICIKPCDKMIWTFDEVAASYGKYIPEDYYKNFIRLRRTVSCQKYNPRIPRISRFLSDLVHKFETKHKVRVRLVNLYGQRRFFVKPYLIPDK